MENRQKGWDFYSLYSALVINFDESDSLETIRCAQWNLMEEIYLTQNSLTCEEAEILFFEFLVYSYKRSKIIYIIKNRQNFLLDLILIVFKNIKEIEEREEIKTPTWLELLEFDTLKNLDLKFILCEIMEDDSMLFTELSIFDSSIILENEELQQEEVEEIDDDEPYVDEFELAFRKRKEKQRIFDIITWGMIFLSVIFSFCFMWLWHVSFIDYLVYLTCMWIDVYIVMAINAWKLREAPIPFLPPIYYTL